MIHDNYIDFVAKGFFTFFIFFFWIPRPTFPQWPAHSWAQIRNTLQQAAGCHGTTFEKDPIFRYFHTGHQTNLYIRTYEHIMYLLYYVQENTCNYYVYQSLDFSANVVLKSSGGFGWCRPSRQAHLLRPTTVPCPIGSTMKSFKEGIP